MGVKTEKLDRMLETVKPGDLDRFLDDNWEDMLDEEKEFSKFMHEIIESKGLKMEDVYLAAGLDETYGEPIINMRRHTKYRDVIIKLCIGARMTWEETNHALTLYGYNALYSRDPRDTVLIVAINKRIYELADIDDMLAAQGLDIISTEIK